ncbi:MAG: tetratricopeptide repeat protein [Candidatus Mcinerneyibacterium aminivorans]|uniref:Tetratricopeptide repeat protein n=1 Tax=Candidatus Mcinerneyibacterium aminivorans TaxID=2703815 RepID=A0A5D0MLF9_9BACT|nr:MAG: tetratricopeptide repeat protein [Candidatus Mcinerneyibacterium aminivorans]
MGKYCPFLKKSENEYVECLTDDCFLYLKNSENCILNEYNLNTDEKMTELTDIIKENNKQKEQLIKKIGSILNKSSNSLFKYLENIENGKLLVNQLDNIYESLKNVNNKELISVQENNIKTLNENFNELIGKIDNFKNKSPEIEKIYTEIKNLNVKENLEELFQLHKRFIDKIYNLTKKKLENLEKTNTKQTKEIISLKKILEKLSDNLHNNQELFPKLVDNVKRIKDEVAEFKKTFTSLKNQNKDKNNDIINNILDLKELQKKTLEAQNSHKILPELQKLNEKFDSFNHKFDKLLNIQQELIEKISNNGSKQDKIAGSVSNINDKILEIEDNQSIFMNNIKDKIDEIKDITQLQKNYIEEENEAIKFKKSKEINEIGLKYLFEGSYEEAINKFKDAIKLNPELWSAYNNLGLAFSYRGENEKAKSVFENLIEKNPDFPEAHYNLGKIFAEDKIYENSLKYLNKSIEMKPQFAKAYKSIGDIYEEKNMIEKAINNWKKALQINPTLDDLKDKLKKYDEFPSNDSKKDG